MKVLIIGGTQLNVIQQNFDRKKIKGIEFVYASEFNRVLDDMEERGFNFDKMVLLCSVLNNWDQIQAESLFKRLVQLALSLDSTKEVIIVDPRQQWYADYANNLAATSNVKYSGDQLKLDNLLDLILGRTTEGKEGVNSLSDKDKSKRSKVTAGTTPKAKTTPFGFMRKKDAEEPKEPAVTEATPTDTDEDTPLFTFDPEVEAQTIITNGAGYGNVEFKDPAIRVEGLDQQQLFDVSGDDETLFETPAQEISPPPQVIEQPVAPPPPPPPPPQPQPKPVKKAPPPKQPSPHKGPVKSTFAQSFTRRSKILTFTGDRRSGVSSITTNCAMTAAQVGLNVLIVDLDMLRKGQAINMPVVADPEDTRYLATLISALRTPYNLENIAVPYLEGLAYIGISLYSTDIRLYREAADTDKLQKLLTYALTKYDLICVDCPFEDINKYECLVTLSNSIVHSINGDTKGIMNAINMICADSFDDIGNYQLYTSKANFVLNDVLPNHIDGMPVNERNLISIFVELTGDDIYEDYRILPGVPHFDDYNKFIMEDKQPAICGYANIYAALLDALCEG